MRTTGTDTARWSGGLPSSFGRQTCLRWVFRSSAEVFSADFYAGRARKTAPIVGCRTLFYSASHRRRLTGRALSSGSDRLRPPSLLRPPPRPPFPLSRSSPFDALRIWNYSGRRFIRRTLLLFDGRAARLAPLPRRDGRGPQMKSKIGILHDAARRWRRAPKR